MSKRKTKSRRPARPSAPGHKPSARSGETSAVDATTIAWTVSVTMVLICDIAAIAAHFYVQSHRSAHNMAMLRELMLFAGAVTGIVSLLLLPVVFRVRRTPPPSGVTVFAVCAAAAPILALIVRNIR